MTSYLYLTGTGTSLTYTNATRTCFEVPFLALHFGSAYSNTIALSITFQGTTWTIYAPGTNESAITDKVFPDESTIAAFPIPPGATLTLTLGASATVSLLATVREL